MGKKQRSKRRHHEDRRQHGTPRANHVRAAFTADRPSSEWGGALAPLLLTFVAISALIGFAYWQVHRFGFVFLDDQLYVSHNPQVLSGLTWSGFKWAFTASAAGNWHPVSWLSHMLDVELFGPEPGAHHVVNVGIHTVNSLLLFAVFVRMTGAVGRSAFVATLFAIHPLHVESVAWISERKDVLSTMFLLATVYAYVSYVTQVTMLRKAAVVLCFALAVMAKPMVITLPFALLLLDVWPLRRIGLDDIRQVRAWGGLLREKLPLFVLVAVAIVLTLRAPAQHGAVVSIERLPFGDRLANAIVSYGHYVLGIFWPVDLAAYYPFRRPAPIVALAVCLLLGLAMLWVLTQFRKRPFLTVGWLWFVGTLVPAIGLIQVGDQARADRFTYVPAIGIFIMVAWGAHELVRRFPIMKVPTVSALVAAVGICTYLARQQVSYWKDDLSLFTHAQTVTQDNYRAETLLGVALSDAGRFAEALPHFEKSLSLVPNNAETHNNYASALDAIGRIADAERELSEAVRLQPSNAVFNYNLAVIRSKQGRTREAIDAISAAIRLDPANKEYRDGLAVLQQRSR